jgi:hypothetical protein
MPLTKVQILDGSVLPAIGTSRALREGEGTMSAAGIHELRSQGLADEIRRLLVGANTGGIAATIALAASSSELHLKLSWAVAPISFFLLGILFATISAFLAQHRELRRRSAAERGENQPTFGLFAWSWLWNWLSLGSFCGAAIFGLFHLANT